MNRLKQAITTLHQHQFLGKQVSHLDVQPYEQPDMNTLLALPQLLPNLTTLTWKVCDFSYNMKDISKW